MTRQRIIREIESLEQAVKVEDDVETGYFDAIDEYLTSWMGVEEDIVDSYARLLAKVHDAREREVLTTILEDSKRHHQELQRVAEILRRIIQDERRHQGLLRSLVAPSR